MSTDLPALGEVERALRPLRRVLARSSPSRAAEPWFAASCARLALQLDALELPAPIDETLGELKAQFVDLASAGVASRAERLAHAWQILVRLDDLLGLPLVDAPALVPRARLLKADEPEPRQGAASSPESGDEGTDRGVLAGARWDTPLVDLDVPDAAVESASDVGLETVADVLSLRPVETETLAPVHGAGRELPEGRVAVGGRVRARFTDVARDGTSRARLVLHGAGPLTARWAGRFSDADLLRTPPGGKAVVIGTTDAGGGLADACIASAWHGKAVRTRYDAIGGGEAVGDLVRLLLDGVASLEDPLPARVVAQHALRPLGEAVLRAHTRFGDEEARRRLAFEEALLLSLALSFARFDGPQEPGVGHAIAHGHVTELQTRDGAAALDDAQQAAFEAIKRDLRAPTPMARVLTGDASAGVDDVVLHALLTVVESRSQVLVVAPDAPSAAVVFGRWETTLRASGIVPLLVSGDPRRNDRDALRRGEAHVAFGTPSAFDLALDWRRLGLVIALEQARYGEIPLRLRALRAPRPDLLVVARTPLPSSILLGAWPNLDLTALPHRGDAPAPGTVWNEAEREAAWHALGAARREGRPLLIAFPMRRGGTDLLTLREVEALVATLRSQVLDDANVVVFHGALQARERVRAWEDFVERRAQVIVATTTLELAGDLPRATVGLIEHADRMDPQRLLGIRALVTSAGHLHYVVGADPDPRGVARVSRLAERAPDAEIIAEGDVFEIAPACGAPPEPAFRWLDPRRDADLLLGARVVAHAILRADPGLRQGSRLARIVHTTWRRLLPDIACPVPPQREPASTSKRRRRRRKR